MEIFITKTAGFCFGVKRAISMAYKCAEETDGGIYTLGPIIHNPQVVSRLEDNHIYAKEGIEEIDSGTVIIRSHGVRLDEYKKAEEKGLNIMDATCPFVKKAQQYVQLLADEGYNVIVVGDKNHPEVKGIVSYGSGAIRVVDSPSELESMPRVRKIGIVAQTTIPAAKLEAIVDFCLNRASELKIFNTICNATSIRQSESEELAGRVDVMLVVGGRNSANTRRLADICRTLQKNTYHIETASELVPGWFTGVKKVGVTSGASTPDWIIEEVVSAVNGYSK